MIHHYLINNNYNKSNLNKQLFPTVKMKPKQNKIQANKERTQIIYKFTRTSAKLLFVK